MPIEVAPIALVEGTSDSIMQFLSGWTAFRQRRNRYLLVVNQEGDQKRVRDSLPTASDQCRFLTYSDLSVNNGRATCGTATILLSSDKAFQNAKLKGMIDAGIIRVLGTHNWERVIVTLESNTSLEIRGFESFQDAVNDALQNVGLEETEFWLPEALLTLCYKRHITRPEIMKEARLSQWWRLFAGSPEKVEQALVELERRRLLHDRRGKYTCTDYGRLIIERESLLSEFDRSRFDEMLEFEKRFEMKESVDALPDDQILDAITHLVEENDWTSVTEILAHCRYRYSGLHTSPAAVRRLLESYASNRTLVKSSYNRGRGRPINIYYKLGKLDPDSLEDRCGTCGFYVKSLERCRLWWALNRFNQAQAYSNIDEFSDIAGEKLRLVGRKMGPKATACEFRLVGKRDYPIRLAKETCLGCGSPVDSPLAKTVECAVCGTKYRPMRDRIAVDYNYEHVFAGRYEKIAGVKPPQAALAVSADEPASNQRAGVIVLYPNEKVKLTEYGLLIRGRGAESLEPYEEIRNVVDYGTLGRRKLNVLQKKGLKVMQRPISFSGLSAEPKLVVGLDALRNQGALARIMTEHLLKSVIIATKRILQVKSPASMKKLLELQLIEYARMKYAKRLNLDLILAFEARTNYHYWRAFKMKLRFVGLDFQSRVRQRFVRELVLNARARARGYSPVNAAINYLHQRRLAYCGSVNFQLGLPQAEGLLHVAKRKQGVGLLLDMVEPFKLADREKLLQACLDSQFTFEDFVSRIGNQRVRFYYPDAEAIVKLERVGHEADMMTFSYKGRTLALTEVYREYAQCFKETLDSASNEKFLPFVYGDDVERDWLETRLKSML